MSIWNGLVTMDPVGIGRSIGLIVILVIGRWWPFRPHFVLPQKKIDLGKYWLTLLFKSILIGTIILLPLDIHLHQGRRLVDVPTSYLQIVLDVSLSMSAKDVGPSRFIAAQETLDTLLASVTETTVGIIAFSGIPIIHIPFSKDITAVRQRLRETTLGDFPPTVEFLGTAIGDSLLLALERIEDIDAKQATILLITDGDTSKGSDPLEINEWIVERNIPLYTLGIGQDITVLGTDGAGEDVFASLDSETLQELALRTGGKSYRITDETTKQATISDLMSRLRAEQRSERVTIYWPLNNLFIPLGLILGGIWLVRQGWVFRKVRQVMQTTSSK